MRLATQEVRIGIFSTQFSRISNQRWARFFLSTGGSGARYLKIKSTAGSTTVAYFCPYFSKKFQKESTALYFVDLQIKLYSFIIIWPIAIS